MKYIKFYKYIIRLIKFMEAQKLVNTFIGIAIAVFLLVLVGVPFLQTAIDEADEIYDDALTEAGDNESDVGVLYTGINTWMGSGSPIWKVLLPIVGIVLLLGVVALFKFRKGY